MKLSYNWSVAMVIALPFAWFVAFFLDLRFLLFPLPNFLPLALSGLFLGFLLGGFLADFVKERVFPLLITQGLLLFLGIIHGVLFGVLGDPLIGTIILFLYFFLFACSLLLFTIFLNGLVPSIRRGRVASAVTFVILSLASVLSITWQWFGTPLVPSIIAAIILFGLVVGFFVRPWRRELQTYMVPGSIVPYLIWWVIYLLAYGLFVYATPTEYRFIFNSLLDFSPGGLFAQLILLGLSGATLVFLFLPDLLGRKRIFTIASLLLGELVLFGPARHGGPELAPVVAQILLVLEIFVIAFILSVGTWLVWAEIGPVRQKGRRVIIGWGLVIILLAAVWVVLSTPLPALQPLLVYPIAATFVLISVFPLMNATEVMPNERVVEDIDISVDTRQVSRALKDLAVDTTLKNIEEQIEYELVQLMKIKGVTQARAKTLRNAGYETPTLVANSDTITLATVLNVSEETAAQIIANAKTLSQKMSKRGVSKGSSKSRSSSSSRKGKSQKRKRS
jgi:hypothetical protein